jgi:hypothetical protein
MFKEPLNALRGRCFKKNIKKLKLKPRSKKLGWLRFFFGFFSVLDFVFGLLAFIALGVL